MTGIRSRRSLLKSTIRGIRELLVIWLWIFERDGRVSTSSHQKCSVLVIGAEEKRFWGYKHLYYYFRFQFCGYCSFWLQKRWTLMPKKLRIYRLRNTALLTIVRYVATGPQWIFVNCRLVVLQSVSMRILWHYRIVVLQIDSCEFIRCRLVDFAGRFDTTLSTVLTCC